MSLPPCRYGSSCFRKLPSHFQEFSHPDRDPPKPVAPPVLEETIVKSSPAAKQHISVELGAKRRLSGTKCASAATVSNLQQIPFHLTKVRGIPDVFNENCYSLNDLLSENSGDLIASCQFDYMIDIPWLMAQYPRNCRDKPLLIVCGSRNSDISSMRMEATKFPNISVGLAPIPDAYGTHHTKMMLLQYTDGVKIVIHTANLVVQDWDQKTQGMFISPLFPVKRDGNGVDSKTHFQRDLLDYLKSYRLKQLDSWMKLLRSCDMSDANVFIIGSIPGRHSGVELTKWGHMKLRQVLSDNFQLSEDLLAQHHQLLAQFSSIGSLGAAGDKWLTAEFLSSLSSTAGESQSSSKKAKTIRSPLKLSLIFPSVDDVRLSLEGYPAGGSIPYGSETRRKQLWLEKHFCRWKADHTERTSASPHLKSYLRCADDFKHLSWLLLSSANLSKAAWGQLEKSSSQLFIRSYELGVMFIPKFVSGADVFLSSLVPFDLPPQPYRPTDSPWVWDVPHADRPDSHGNVWRPE